MRLPGQRPNAGMHALSQGSEYTIRNSASTTFQAVDEFVFSNHNVHKIVDGGIKFYKNEIFWRSHRDRLSQGLMATSSSDTGRSRRSTGNFRHS